MAAIACFRSFSLRVIDDSYWVVGAGSFSVDCVVGFAASTGLSSEPTIASMNPAQEDNDIIVKTIMIDIGNFLILMFLV
jgi:hypothetical protein